jgi:hypothetical protein
MGAAAGFAGCVCGCCVLTVTVSGSAAVACQDCLGATCPAVRIRLVDAVGLPADTRHTIVREIEAAWPAAVLVDDHVQAGTGCNGTPPTIHVLLRHAAPRRTPASGAGHAASSSGGVALAWIPFEGDRASSVVFVSVPGVSRLLEALTFAGRPVSRCPDALKHALLGRALGRVVAHEIGHYLHGPAHAPAGLMKPVLTGDDLLGEHAPVPLPVTSAASAAVHPARR